MTIWPDKEYIKKYLDRLICALYYDKSILEIQYNDDNPISNFVIIEEKRISCSSIIIGIDIYKKFINNFINENPELSGDNEISSIIIEDMVGLLSEYLANKATFHIEGIVSSRLCTPSYLIITKEILDSFKDYYLKHSKIYNFINSGCFNYLDEINIKCKATKTIIEIDRFLDDVLGYFKTRENSARKIQIRKIYKFINAYFDALYENSNNDYTLHFHLEADFQENNTLAPFKKFTYQWKGMKK